MFRKVNPLSFTGEPNLPRTVWLRWKRFAKNIIAGKTMFNQDFKEFIESLNANQVRYLVVGG